MRPHEQTTNLQVNVSTLFPCGTQWAIEVLHWIRDTLWREDNSTARTRSGPRVLASLRNLTDGAFRLAGRTDITEASRWACRNMTRPFTILGLTS